MKIDELKEHPKNRHRKITRSRMQDLMDSIREKPWMMAIKKIKYNASTMQVIGGDKRWKALKGMGYTEIPEEWIQAIEGLTPEMEDDFILEDNNHYGISDKDILVKDFDHEDLKKMLGIDPRTLDQKNESEGEIRFSVELDHASNYVVLKFQRDIDFIHVQSILGIESTFSRRANGKPWTKGVGRVVDGIQTIKKIQEAKS